VRPCRTNKAGESACQGGMGEIGADGNVSYCINGTAGPLCSLCINEGDYLVRVRVSVRVRVRVSVRPSPSPSPSHNPNP
jgi:hypothetical protein